MATTRERPFALQPGMRLHLVGIGGAGMSAIARVLLGRGFVVSGSDTQRNALTDALLADGVQFYEGHRAGQVNGADALVVSSAVPDDNPEVTAARRAGLPVVKRAELLGHLMAGTAGIAVAGTHGKTTTTGMIAHILMESALDPTVILGGVLPEIGGNGRAGSGPYFVIEADEYDHMFLGLRPSVAVITNVEHDHPDLFPTAEAYRRAFTEFARLLPDGGRLVICADDAGALQLLGELKLSGVEIVTYGLEQAVIAGAPVNFQATDIRLNQTGGSDFVVVRDGRTIGLARLRVPGDHNVRNALAAVAVALGCGIEFVQIGRALAAFGGVQRRFQVVGEAGGVTVIDDYGHHPTEIQATLAAARRRYPGRRIWAIWQPHTFSRTRLLLQEFADSFADADRVIVLDIYRSRERDDPGMQAQDVVDLIVNPQAIYAPGRENAVGYLLDRVLPDDVIVTLSAGDGNLVGLDVLDGLRKRIGEKGITFA